jgi:hypothetical protein
MARKKKTDVDERWEHYLSIQLTPEQKAAARVEMQKEIDRARAAGVYEKLLGFVGNVEWSVSVAELRGEED